MDPLHTTVFFLRTIVQPTFIEQVKITCSKSSQKTSSTIFTYRSKDLEKLVKIVAIDAMKVIKLEIQICKFCDN